MGEGGGRRARALGTVVVAVSLVVGGVWFGVSQWGVGPALFGGRETCTATVDGNTVALSVEQAENAATIASVAVQRGLPARAVSIALATAYQESDLENIDYGDRDSLGLFQQRPSQGWGTPEQVQDPVYAANAFYDELVQVSGYRDMEITEAAQTVQRSAFPDAYADHEIDARVLASALTGNSRAVLGCEIDAGADTDTDAVELGQNGLVERSEAVRVDIAEAFGDQSFGGFAPQGVSTGHQPGSTHYEGRAVDVFFRPINDANLTRGWAIAQYLVAHADRLDVQTVIYDTKIWTARRSAAGWRDYDVPDRPGDPDILAHRDHIHVDVFDG